ncbi:hypothetical protein O3P69_004916 [Scylla paramamosain]|uniref:Uncharacterized protein n=1 Tax=Scylla paramamosain TaxID=85552 RepID=A0AAW0UDS1_SCYPA
MLSKAQRCLWTCHQQPVANACYRLTLPGRSTTRQCWAAPLCPQVLAPRRLNFLMPLLSDLRQTQLLHHYRQQGQQLQYLATQHQREACLGAHYRLSHKVTSPRGEEIGRKIRIVESLGTLCPSPQWRLGLTLASPQWGLLTTCPPDPTRRAPARPVRAATAGVGRRESSQDRDGSGRGWQRVCRVWVYSSALAGQKWSYCIFVGGSDAVPDLL